MQKTHVPAAVKQDGCVSVIEIVALQQNLMQRNPTPACKCVCVVPYGVQADHMAHVTGQPMWQLHMSYHVMQVHLQYAVTDAVTEAKERVQVHVVFDILPACD
jgi:hypothetical protein